MIKAMFSQGIISERIATRIKHTELSQAYNSLSNISARFSIGHVCYLTPSGQLITYVGRPVNNGSQGNLSLD